VTTVTPAQQRTLAVIEAELARLVRYDDESVVHEAWIRQRYDGGFAASYAPARAAAVRTAWHEAGHAVAALELGARFSSASIRAGAASAGRVHAIRGGGELGFVIDAAGQVAERLRDWTLPGTDAEVRAWLASWRDDGGDARRFRAGISARFGADEAAAWRYAAATLTPLRPRIRDLARALLVYPRHLPYPVTAAIAGFSGPSSAGPVQQADGQRGGYGIRSTLPVTPRSTASCAAAISLSGNRRTGSSVSAPAASAPETLATAASRAPAVIP
jgi:hypothetical protein